MNNRWENPHTDDLAVLQAWALERRAYLKTVLAAGPLPRVAQSPAIASYDAEIDTAGNADIGGAHPDPLGAIQAELDSLWLTHPHVPDAVRTHMSIAAAEIGANIIEHTGGRQPVVMRMGSELVGDQVHVIFTDDGPPIDVRAATLPEASEIQSSGRRPQGGIERQAGNLEGTSRFAILHTASPQSALRARVWGTVESSSQRRFLRDCAKAVGDSSANSNSL